MKIIFYIVIFFLFSFNVISREKGETEITTEDGIEVFQNEKFYLLKKNVIIKSDSFFLNANDVKINFEDNLYDISEINAKGAVQFNSPDYGINGSGDFLRFEVKIEKLKIEGIDSKLKTADTDMFSDGFIEVNNLNGDFYLRGKNSKLINESILIKGESINGNFSTGTDIKSLTFLKVEDKEISYVKNNNTEMFAKKINYNDNTSIIELIDSVTIIRGEEKITGDYGTLDTKNN